jgi:hypothetical protein
MILKVHVQGAASYDIGDEIWQEPLADAINAEAEMIAGYAGADVLESPRQAHRDALRVLSTGVLQGRGSAHDAEGASGSASLRTS